jgi:hypothetical protein
MWVEIPPGYRITVNDRVAVNPSKGKSYVWRDDVVCSGRERLGE